MFIFLFSKAKQVTKNSNSLSTKDIVFQNVRLEETNNGNHLVIRQATPEAEGVSSNSWKEQNQSYTMYDFLAVQDSSIGDIVTHSLTHSLSESVTF